MADIKKTIKLIATLDDSAFKQQIANLKKQLGKDISLNSVDVTEFKNAFKDIAKEFSKEIKEALKDVNKIKGATGSTGRKQVIEDESQVRKKSWKEEFDAREKVFNKEHRKKDDQFKFEQRFNDQERRKDQEAAVKRYRDLQQNRLKDQTKKSELDRDLLTKGLTGLGVDRDKARGITEKFGGMSGLASRGISAAGAAGGAIMGGIELARMYQERQYRYAKDISEETGIEAEARQQGRGSSIGLAGGALAGGAIGLKGGMAIGTAIAPGVGTAIGGAIGGLGGAAAGAFAGSNAFGEYKAGKVAPLEEAYQFAKQQNMARIAALSGGGINEQGVLSLQKAGVSQGFKTGETLQQFNALRQFGGNAGAAQALPGLQRLQRQTGVDLESLGSAQESFAGYGRKGFGASTASTDATLKKAVSAGLDASQSGKFLQATSQLLQSSAGIAGGNKEAIEDKLARAIAAITPAGGTATGIQVEQAKDLLMRQQGVSQDVFGGGISSYLNYSGTSKALEKAGLTNITGAQRQMLGSMTGYESPEDIKNIAKKSNLDANQVQAFSGYKKDQNFTNEMPENLDFANKANLAKMAGLVSGPAEYSNAEDMFKGGKLKPGELPSSAVGTQTGKLMQGLAEIDYTKVIRGFGEFGNQVDLMPKKLEAFIKALDAATKAATEIQNSRRIDLEKQ